MLSLRANLIALLLGVAAASPVPSNYTAPPSNNAANITLYPTRGPNVDGQNLTNLLGTTNFLLHFDSDPNPSTDSVVSTVSAADAPHPIIQLQDTDYISSITCSDDAATIVFNNRTAFAAAVADWQQHDQFVLFSHDPNCGSGYNEGAHDYALVSSMTPDNSSMTIRAAMQLVDYETAVGGDTLVHVAMGQYTAPASSAKASSSKAKAKRLSIHHSKSAQLQWNEYPTNALSTTQFGTGYQLLQSSELDVICAGCGTQGDLQFTGDLVFSLTGGFKSTSVTLTGSMAATLQLGLVANGLQASIPIGSVQFASITLPGFSIPKIVSFGPQIDLSAAAHVHLDATGSMQLGTALSWPSINIELGVDNDSSQQVSGLVPSFTPNFQASGALSTALDLSLPVSVGVGIDILDGKFNKQLAIVDTPTFALTTEEGTAGATSCSGVGLSGALENSVGANIVGLTTIPLASTSLPLFSTCIGGSSASATPSPTTTSASMLSFTTITPLKDREAQEASL